jgi:signal transduction histidine kinase/CheY-like chemotaxis protein
VRTHSDWRRRVLNVTLGVTAALAGVAYVPGMMAAWSGGLVLMMVTDTVALATVLTLALKRTLPYAVRAGGFIVVCYLLAIVLLVEVGPVGGGAVWLLAFPVLTAVLFGLRGAAISLVVTLVTIFAVGVAAWEQGLVPGSPEVGPGYDLQSWAATSASVFFLGAVLSLSVAYLIRSLEQALDEAGASRERLAASNRDIRREMEERRNLEAQLLQSQKMEALGTLAGGIAHDFNNLLVPILMEARELRERDDLNGSARESLDSIVRSASRARDIVRGILSYSRGVESERFPVDVDPIVREVGTLLRSTVRAEIHFEFALGAEGERVLADPTALHQIIMNLGTNACLAMKEKGGTIRFITRTIGKGKLPGPDGLPGPERPVLVIEVHDTGRGMPPEVLARARDPFFTTRRSSEGTGLGLALVHRMVTELEGVLEIRSEPGKGTVVQVILPRAPRESPTVVEGPAGHTQDHPKRSGGVEGAGTIQGERGSTGAPMEGRPVDTVSRPRVEEAGNPEVRKPETIGVLVVDDEDLVRRTIRMILTRLGYRVQEASTPESALRQIAEDEGAIQLVLTDQAMPGMTGLQLASRLRKLRPELPIILASGYLDNEAMEKVEELDLEGVLNKPYDRAELHECIRRAVEEGGAGRTDTAGPFPEGA